MREISKSAKKTPDLRLFRKFAASRVFVSKKIAEIQKNAFETFNFHF